MINRLEHPRASFRYAGRRNSLHPKIFLSKANILPVSLRDTSKSQNCRCSAGVRQSGLRRPATDSTEHTIERSSRSTPSPSATNRVNNMCKGKVGASTTTRTVLSTHPIKSSGERTLGLLTRCRPIPLVAPSGWHYKQWLAHFGEPPGSGAVMNSTVPKPAILLAGILMTAFRQRLVVSKTRAFCRTRRHSTVKKRPAGDDPACHGDRDLRLRRTFLNSSMR
jgi:hypothetical protein